MPLCLPTKSSGFCLLASFAGLLLAFPFTASTNTIQTPLADGFDFPVGKPHGFGYYRYRGFRANHHMGEDWNGLGGGNSDYGKPVYSVAHGVVVYSDDYRSNWGNVIVIRHAYREAGQIYYVDSLYGHLKDRFVKAKDPVTKGFKIGSIGTNRGMYTAHLHFEVRKNINIGLIHSRYAMDLSNYHSPTPFIEQRRSFPLEFKPHPIPILGPHSNLKNRYAGARLPELPEDPLQKPKPPPRLDPVVRTILLQHNFLPSTSKPPTDIALDPSEADERSKIRSFWSSSRQQIEQLQDSTDRLGHDETPAR